MINKLLFHYFLVVCLAVCPWVHSQNLDLIVTTEGDSIACRIDSVSDSKIMFSMRNKGQWINTGLGLEKVSFYEREVIRKQDYIFQPGSSRIETAFQSKLQKNSIYLGLGSLCYGRTFPGYPASFTIAGGLAWPDGLGIYLESTAMFGKYKHYFETGLATAFLPYDSGLGFLGVILRCGYRYQGPKGFLFRSAPTLGFIDGEIIPLPALSLGYSF